MNKKKLCLNTFTAVVNQFISLICGFILPRQILLAYGSDINGLVSSITQFLGLITFFDMGVGSVVQSALYKPLAEKDFDTLSRIIIASNKFFRKIAFILIVYTFLLMFFFPTFIDKGNGFFSTTILVFVLSISSVGQYFLGITNQLLLNADQKSYIQFIPQSIVTILNTIVSVILIRFDVSINSVKFISALVFMIRPLWMNIYVSKNYKIDYKIKYKKDPIKQKWNAIAQHVATFITDKTDILILTLFSTLTNVSIYSVYHLVVNGLYQTFGVVTSSLQAFWGDMYARKEIQKLKRVYNIFEWAIHATLVIIFSCTHVLIIPFIKVYTKGITDANYIMPLFAFSMTIAFAGSCLKSYYNILIKAVGHFKQTQKSAIIEAILNICISLILVYMVGLVGVAIGTLVAMYFRAFYLKLYTDKEILKQSSRPYIKQCVTDGVAYILIVFLSKGISMNEISYIAWIFTAIKILGISVIVTILINLIFYKNNVITLYKVITPEIK